MREIKFRAKAGLRWCYGEFYHSERNEPVIYEPHSRGKTLEGIPYDGWRLKVNPETVGQYTGLRDSDGREIYEGDIIQSEYAEYLAVVKFRKGAFVAVTGPVESYQALSGVLRLKGLRVIGNVHDNPELLERKL